MRHDDRLATVLRLPISGPAMARVQLTQLLDLLGTAPPDARGDLLDAGYLRVTALCRTFPDHEVAAMLAEPGLRLRSPRLVASLCQASPQVAKAVLHTARLDEASWLDLIPALQPTCWALLWQRRDLAEAPRVTLARLGGGAIALPAAASPSAVPADGPTREVIAPQPVVPAQIAAPAAFVAESADTQAKASAAPALAEIAEMPPTLPAAIEAPKPPADTLAAWQHQPEDGIGAIVRRIEAFRRARDSSRRQTSVSAPLWPDAPRLPLGEDPATPAPIAFDIETDSEGCVIRADGGVAPMVVGLDLGELVGTGDFGAEAASAPDGLAECIRHQQPIRAVVTHLFGAPAITGVWQLDAIPHFDLLAGRFVGYLGRFRRLPASPSVAPPADRPETPPADSRADRLRQSLHELRTPVNAIQGFAEIIQQQLFGPTPHEYRALAAAIAADAAHMLAGFEELERLARIDSGAMELIPGTSDLSACVGAALVQMEPNAALHGVLLEMDGTAPPLPLALAAIETERLCWRLLATLVASAASGERLRLRLTREEGCACLSISLPVALAALAQDGADENDVFRSSVTPAHDGPSAGMFGTGFALRLARAEARAAGGSLSVARDQDGGNAYARLRLCLPGLTQPDEGHSVEPLGKTS